MLLAAAAAVIDDEGKYKGRSYERREIRLYGRHGKMKGHCAASKCGRESNVFCKVQRKESHLRMAQTMIAMVDLPRPCCTVATAKDVIDTQDPRYQDIVEPSHQTRGTRCRAII